MDIILINEIGKEVVKKMLDTELDHNTKLEYLKQYNELLKNIPNKLFYKLEDLANMLGLTRKYVGELVRDGKIPCCSINSQHYFLPASIIRFLQKIEKKETNGKKIKVTDKKLSVQ